jgi:hypothetical protein
MKTENGSGFGSSFGSSFGSDFGSAFGRQESGEILKPRGSATLR